MHEHRTKFDADPTDGWSALRYAARRLEPSEQARFEARLADDVTACAAVAQAVELAHTVAFLHLDDVAEVAAIGPASALVAAAKKSDFLAQATAAANAETSLDADAHVEVAPAPRADRRRSHFVAGMGWMVAAVVLGFVYVRSRATPVDVVDRPGQVTATEQVGLGEQVTGDQVTSAWASLAGRRLTGEEPALPVEEVAIEQTNLREIPREADEALMLDWLLSGLRDENPNAAQAVPN